MLHHLKQRVGVDHVDGIVKLPDAVLPNAHRIALLVTQRTLDWHSLRPLSLTSLPESLSTDRPFHGTGCAIFRKLKLIEDDNVSLQQARYEVPDGWGVEGAPTLGGSNFARPMFFGRPNLSGVR